MSNLWFDAIEAGDGGWALAVDIAVKTTLLFLLALAVHASVGRGRALVRSGLWNAVLLALIVQPAVTIALPRLRITCLPATGTRSDAVETRARREAHEFPDPRSNRVADTTTSPVATSPGLATGPRMGRWTGPDRCRVVSRRAPGRQGSLSVPNPRRSL